jgi:tetratricopeptide (TPR) repeat protein
MNTNFLSIVKRIVSEQGEAILANPQQLKGLISDYAKDEPKAERLAFGRCIEYGAYTELKNAPPGSRAAVKNRLAQRLHSGEGLDTELCAGVLDLLEAAMFGALEVSGAGNEWVTVAEQKAAGQAKPTAPPPEPVPLSPPPQVPAGNIPSKKHVKRNVFIAAAIIVVVAASVWLFVHIAANSVFEKGLALYEQNDYDGAIESFTKAINLESKNARAYAGRGRSYWMKYDYDRAIVDCTEAIKLDPEYVRAYAVRGDSYREKGDYDRAIADCTEAIIRNPEYAFAYATRGDSYREKGDYDRAIADCTEAIKLDPTYAFAYVTRGDSYWGKDDYDHAITDCTEAIKLDPAYAFAYATRGESYLMKGGYDRAIADLESALYLYPDYSWAKELLEIAGRRGRLVDSQSISELKGDYTSLHTTGYEYLYMKYFWAENKNPANLDKAIEYDSAAYLLYPQGNAAYELTQAYSERGILYYNNGNYALAIADFIKCLSIDPEYAETSSQTIAKQYLKLARKKAR